MIADHFWAIAINIFFRDPIAIRSQSQKIAIGDLMIANHQYTDNMFNDDSILRGFISDCKMLNDKFQWSQSLSLLKSNCGRLVAIPDQKNCHR